LFHVATAVLQKEDKIIRGSPCGLPRIEKKYASLKITLFETVLAGCVLYGFACVFHVLSCAFYGVAG